MAPNNKNICHRAALAAALAILSGSGAQGAVITPELEAELAVRAPDEDVSVILSFSDRVNRRQFEMKDRLQRNSRLFNALKEKAVATQGTLRTLLQNNRARRVRELWVINGMAFTVPASLVRTLARLPGVESVRPDSILQAPETAAGNPAPPEWNLSAVGAPDLWSLGYSGAGVVVANMDTGVDPTHPDLAGKWRGGSNSWYDPHGEHASPYDPVGHGTQTMGIIVGGAIGGTAIGVAPDASWIAVKLYNDAGQATYSDIHLAFQWLLDPDGDPNTVDAPDVVNASWGLVGTEGRCITEFNQDIDVLKAAGTAIAFAAGNDGPAPLTSLSPANNPAGFSIGAVDPALVIANFSSRGQSACDGSIYPRVAAPGVNVKTSDLSFGGFPLYRVVSGTSYAAPHAAGAMALLAGAFPSANVAQLEMALIQSARDLGVAGEDNSYGYGLVDMPAAYQVLLAGSGTGNAPSITSTPPVTATEGSPYSYAVTASDTDGDTLTYSLDVAPADMRIHASSGLIAWTPSHVQLGSQTVTARATDPAGLFATQSFMITVTGLNVSPVAQDELYRMIQRGTLNIPAPGMLANDRDTNAGDTLSAVNFGALAPAGGTLVRNSNGSFSMTPPQSYTGTKRFTYQAQDNHGALSNVATVSITVSANRPPLAVNDTATAPVRRHSPSYVPVIINVLANDSDPDTAIDPANVINPASVTISNAPNKGGKVVVNANGTIAYSPKLNFTGKESFRYRVRDTYGTPANSNATDVSVTVK
ncbi:S8 family serine peptidase [Rhodoferax ferrireducens]|uniref:S8 family serine peptidase n=1 Tax=Rhodoferax ferrireducens TaxID=192843 RepID=UPI000E0D6B0D|nr:S8 family serine peptidase [Rhodoferax ferrireducens]